MYILDAATDLQAIAAWGSFIVSIVSAFLTGVVIFQSKKIKELSEIIKELQSSNNIIANQLRLQQIITLPERIPYFVFHDMSESPLEHKIFLRLQNIGVETKDIRYGGEYDVKITRDKKLKKGQLLNIEITTQNPTIDNFSFSIIPVSIHNIETEQCVHRNKPLYDFKVDSPKDPF